jgi:hypothetical protein
LDSCLADLGGSSNQQFAWHFKVPDKLLFPATNNLLEYLAAIVSPWIITNPQMFNLELNYYSVVC